MRAIASLGCQGAMRAVASSMSPHAPRQGPTPILFAKVCMLFMLNPPFSVAAFVVNSEPHTGAHTSVRLCVGPELASCIHNSVYVYVCNAYVL
jgi:hypothetical protein